MKRVLFLLGHLSHEDIEWIIKNGNKKYIDEGFALVESGKNVEHLYIILSGELKVVSKLAKSDIAKLKSGEVVGEMSLIEKRLPSVSVIASERSEVFFIPIELIESRMSKNVEFKSNFYYAIALFLSNRLRKTTDQLGYSNPEEIDEIDMNILDNVADAGGKFMEVLQKFAEV